MNIKELVFGLQHIGLPTGNVAETVEFYSKFGFEIDFEIWADDPIKHVAFIKNGSCVYEIYYSAEPAMKTGAIDHISLDVTDIQAAYDYCRELGFEAIQGKICDLPFYANGVKFFTIEGPNNEKLEFNQKL